MQRRIFITLFISMFAIMVGSACIAPFLSIYAKQFGAGGVEIGLIFIGFHLSRTIFAPFLGNLSDKYGRRSMLSLGLIWYMITSIAYLWTTGIWSLFLIRLFQGASAGMVLPVVLAYIGEISPSEKEGTFMGIFNIAFFGGLGFGPLLGGILYDYFNIQAIFYVLGIFSALAFFMTRIFLPVKEPWRKGTNSPARLFDPRLLSIPSIQGVCLFRLTIAFGIGVNWSFLPLYVMNHLELSGSGIGIILSINVLTSALLQGPAGVFADKVNRRNIIFSGGFLAAAALLLTPFCDSFRQLFAVNLIIGLASGVAMPALMALTTVEGKRLGMGAVMGLITSFHSLGIIFGAISGGFMFDWFGFGPAYTLAGAVGLLGSLLFLYVTRQGG